MAVCSILYQLATRPGVQEKMFAELQRVLPDPDTPLTARHLDQLAYTKGFVKEVLRWVPHRHAATPRLDYIVTQRG